MIAMSRLPYQLLNKYYKIIYIGSILVLFTVLIPGLGFETNGARRWIHFLGQQMQPSEITKIGLIIFYAGYFTDPKNKLDTKMGNTIIPILALLLPIGILLLIQNHMSAGIVISIVTIIMILMSGCKLKNYAVLAGSGIAMLLLAFPFIKDKIMGSFRSDRIEAWLNPIENSSDKAYQTLQGLYAIGSGGLFGVGLGQSKQKYLYIPEAHNDFIFAILAEELGFVGCALILFLFATLAIRGSIIAVNASDMFGSIIAIGITALITVQAVLNIAVVTNTIPNTGISLPFLSYGGTSLIILLGSIGILLNISRSAKKL